MIRDGGAALPSPQIRQLAAQGRPIALRHRASATIIFTRMEQAPAELSCRAGALLD